MVYLHTSIVSPVDTLIPLLFLFVCLFVFHTHIYFPASGHVVDTGVVPSPPRFLPSIFIAHRVQHISHCSSIFHRVLLTHALALSASQFVHKKKSPRIYASTCMHSEGFELTKPTYTRLEDNLIRHRGDRLYGTRSTVHEYRVITAVGLYCLMVSFHFSKIFFYTNFK